MPRIPMPCPQCALPTPAGTPCGHCLAHPPPFARAVAAFAYAFPVDRLLQRLKYGGALPLAHWAGDALATAVVAAGAHDGLPDVMVALPLAAARQRERGFNQAQEIAREVARVVRRPLEPLLVRCRATAPQASLPWSARQGNVRGVFACPVAVAGRRIAVVDDVMTTGATLAEAARTLLQRGAADVHVWVVARTLPPA